MRICESTGGVVKAFRIHLTDNTEAFEYMKPKDYLISAFTILRKKCPSVNYFSL